MHSSFFFFFVNILKYFTLDSAHIETVTSSKRLNQTCVHITEQQYLVSINQASADIVHVWRHLFLGFSISYLFIFSVACPLILRQEVDKRGDLIGQTS